MLKIYLKLLQKYRPSAGWTLAELMIAAAMTLVVVMVAGFGLVTILKENKVANATGEMQYDLNRATEFISEEIRSAKTIENKLSKDDLESFAPNFLSFKQKEELKTGRKITPVLALKIDGVSERVIYYVDEVPDDDIWKGPGVIKRREPAFDANGSHSDDQKTNPANWDSLALVDMMALDLTDDQKQCKNLPFDSAQSDGINTYIATDNEGYQWHRQPQATADVRGFFVCVRGDKQLAQLNVLGTSVDEFKHLYKHEKDKPEEILQKQTRHTDNMQYTVSTMAHARSDVIGGIGPTIPNHSVVDGPILFKEYGEATIKVFYVNVPCLGDPNNTSNDTVTQFYILDPVSGSDLKSVGEVEKTGTGTTATFEADHKANAHIEEKTTCTRDHKKIRIAANDENKIKYATNDNGTQLNDIIPNPDPSSPIVKKLTDEGLIKKASDGSYDFTLADHVVLYFVEFAFDTGKLIVDSDGKLIKEPQNDPPHFDDAIFLVEMTK